MLNRRLIASRHAACLIVAVAALLTAASPARSALIDDFEDVSDWTVSVGSGASSGSISTSAVEAQVGSFAGQFDYGLTTAVGFDFVQYTKAFSSPMDITGQLIQLHLNQPTDADMLLQLRFVSGNGGFLEYDFPEGNDSWTQYGIPFASFVDFGSGPDLTDIVSVRWQANGDISTVATTDTFFVDQMVIVPEPSAFALSAVGLLSLGFFSRRRRGRR